MKIFLNILQNEKISTVEMKIDSSLIIGRSSQSNLQVSDQKASGKHCSFTFKKNKLELTDLKSKNGTFLNGIRVDQAQVFFGDQVTIGDCIFSLDEKLTDPKLSEMLTFPGITDEKNNIGLVADFTGARTKNQLRSSRKKTNNNQNQEINLRKKAKSKIWLSKEEIRKENQSLSKMAILIDIFSIILSFCLPIYLILAYTRLNFNRSQALIIIYAAASAGVFYGLNFKVFKFTVGELISGIRKIYLKQ